MRNMSFMLTTEQFKNQTKTVTRRDGWKFLKPGDRLMGVEKCQGLKKGEKINRLGDITIRTVQFERLDRMITKRSYGLKEVIKEGFPKMTPEQFVEMFCKHNNCTPDTIITRISYKYVIYKEAPGPHPCHKCGQPGFKTDGRSRAWCESCSNIELHKAYEVFDRVKKQERNALCSCGSGKKFKKCCLTNPIDLSIKKS